MVTILAAFVLTSSPHGQPAPDYRQEIREWRAGYARSLERPEGWLSVAGLFWLKEGKNSLGSAPGSAVLLPKRVSPARLGSMKLANGRVTLQAEPGSRLLLNGAPPPSETPLAADTTGRPDRLQVGDVTFKVIQRGSRTGVRLYDPRCEERVKYRGLHWFPTDSSLVIQARFVPYDPPKSATITNVIGDRTEVRLPGYLKFKVNGVECRLDAEAQEGGLFLNFQDGTSGKSTYPAGRFLDVPAPVNGVAVLDFNKATNPPCAYTAFATCPLPPAGNRLSVEIRAGEKSYHARPKA